MEIGKVGCGREVLRVSLDQKSVVGEKAIVLAQGLQEMMALSLRKSPTLTGFGLELLQARQQMRSKWQRGALTSRWRAQRIFRIARSHVLHRILGRWRILDVNLWWASLVSRTHVAWACVAAECRECFLRVGWKHV